MNQYQRAAYFLGCINIAPSFTFDETAAIVGEALGVEFAEEQTGKFEEYPAYVAYVLGLELSLLAPPLPEDDLRDVKDNNFQLVVRTYGPQVKDGICLDISRYLFEVLAKKAQLQMEVIEHIHAP